MKFRQWLPDGRFVIWGIVKRCDGAEHFVLPSQPLNIDVKDCVHQLSTNTFDDFGNEIFEGDIVLIEDWVGQINREGEFVTRDSVKRLNTCPYIKTEYRQIWINSWRI